METSIGPVGDYLDYVNRASKTIRNVNSAFLWTKDLDWMHRRKLAERRHAHYFLTVDRM